MSSSESSDEYGNNSGNIPNTIDLHVHFSQKSNNGVAFHDKNN